MGTIMVHKTKKKSRSRKELLNVWFETEYDKSVKAFRQTFGHDYDVPTIAEELDLMNKDVKKAPTWQLKELVGYIED